MRTLTVALHVIVAALVALPIGLALAAPGPASLGIVVVGCAFCLVYVAGMAAARLADEHRAAALAWLAMLCAVWLALLVLTADAAYLVFPLFFFQLHLLRIRAAIVAVVVSTAVSICGIGLHGSWTVGGVAGPLLAAGVAVVIALAYELVTQQREERERIMAELVSTRDELAASERRAGALAERARLGRDLHDTVAQGLASIQLLLHAAERADPDGPGVAQLRLARETAAENLAETRDIIRELSPSPLESAGIAESLRRLGERASATGGLSVTVVASASLELPTEVGIALYRIAQGTLSNVVRHSGAAHAQLELALRDGAAVLLVSDDGDGFEPATAPRHPGDDSFGLRAIRERVEQLDGQLDLDSAPGRGTRLTVRLPLVTR